MAFSNGYTYRRSLTIDNTKVSGSSDLTSFPMLVKGTYAYLATVANGGDVTDADGFDIIFETSTGTTLDHEIESYTASDGSVVFWVRIPTLIYNSDTVIYMYYGNSSVTTSQESVADTWVQFKGVWHLNEALGSGTFKDRTVNANNMSSNGSQLTAGLAGKINKAVQRNNTTTEVSRLFTDANVTLPNGPLWVSFWLRPDLANRYNGNAQACWQADNGRFRFYTTGSLTLTTRVYETSSNLDSGALKALTQSTWHHISGRISDVTSDWYQGYVDGVSEYTGDSVDKYIGTTTKIAMLQSSSIGQGYAGTVSHLKIAITDLGEGWIVTEHNNHDSPSTFYEVGSEETDGGGTTPTSDFFHLF